MYMPPVSQIDLLKEQSLFMSNSIALALMTPSCMTPVKVMKSRQDFLINHRFYQQPVMLMSNNYMVPLTREENIPRVNNAMNLTMSHKFCRPTMNPCQGTSIKAIAQVLNVKVPPLSGENALVADIVEGDCVGAGVRGVTRFPFLPPNEDVYFLYPASGK